MKIGFRVIFVLLCIPFYDISYAQYKIVSADSIINNIDYYKNKQVVIEGDIVHICGLDGKKMKFRTDGGEIIKIISKDSLFVFDSSFYKQRIIVWGIVKENRIDKSYIDIVKNDLILLCHIDYSPCKDSVWVKNMINTGAVIKKSNSDIDKLNEKMKANGKNYISVVTVIAEKIEIKKRKVKNN